MAHLGYGDIQPGEGIGILKSGMTFEQIEKVITEYEIEDLGDVWLIKAQDVHVWIHKEKNHTYQIMVLGDFKSKYVDVIGIGSTLGDVKKYLGLTWHEELEVIVLDNEPGMCLEPTDDAYDDWDENEDFEKYQLRAPIGNISVRRYVPGQPRWDEVTQSINRIIDSGMTNAIFFVAAPPVDCPGSTSRSGPG